MVLGTLAFFLIEYQNPDTLGPVALQHKLLIAWLHSVITRTAGFNSIDIGAMGNASLFIMIALMFVGASPGSTGGGIKTTTPQNSAGLHAYGTSGQRAGSCVPAADCYYSGAEGDLRSRRIGSCGRHSTALVSLTNPTVSFIDILFEAVSAFVTVGLSTGITADLSDVGKYVIIFTMYLGQVGVLLFMAALLGDPKQSAVQYPAEELLVG